MGWESGLVVDEIGFDFDSGSILLSSSFLAQVYPQTTVDVLKGIDMTCWEA